MYIFRSVSNSINVITIFVFHYGANGVSKFEISYNIHNTNIYMHAKGAYKCTNTFRSLCIFSENVDFCTFLIGNDDITLHGKSSSHDVACLSVHCYRINCNELFRVLDSRNRFTSSHMDNSQFKCSGPVSALKFQISIVTRAAGNHLNSSCSRHREITGTCARNSTINVILIEMKTDWLIFIQALYFYFISLFFKRCHLQVERISVYILRKLTYFSR